jgi:hypothetical protein
MNRVRRVDMAIAICGLAMNKEALRHDDVELISGTVIAT